MPRSKRIRQVIIRKKLIMEKLFARSASAGGVRRGRPGSEILGRFRQSEKYLHRAQNRILKNARFSTEKNTARTPAILRRTKKSPEFIRVYAVLSIQVFSVSVLSLFTIKSILT